MTDVRAKRFVAAIIDYIISMFLATFGSIIIAYIVNSYLLLDSSFILFITTPLVFILTMFFYYTLIPYLLNGASIGKTIVKIKVVKLDYQMASFFQYLIRNTYFFISVLLLIFSFSYYINSHYPFGSTFVLYIFLYLLAIFVINCINLLMIIATDEHRAMHDFIAKTFVVHKHFSTDPKHQINLLEKQHMDWAIFEDEVQKEETISLELGNNNDDEIEILKRID